MKNFETKKNFPGDLKFGMKNAMFNLNGGHVKVIKFKWELLLGVFDGSNHDPETKITKIKMTDTINVKDSMFFSGKLKYSRLTDGPPKPKGRI
jgi:hypothetical protein